MGKFVIQVSRFGLIWSTVKKLDDAGKGKALILNFSTYDDTIEHVKSIGLDKLYKDKSINRFNEFIEQRENGNFERRIMYTGPGFKHVQA
jgi:hypothetical protein